MEPTALIVKKIKIHFENNKPISSTSQMYECLFLYTLCSITRQSPEKLLFIDKQIPDIIVSIIIQYSHLTINIIN